jgi:L-ascorbate metabolism protein UlaG (beta-lactamase superfamily)
MIARRWAELLSAALILIGQCAVGAAAHAQCAPVSLRPGSPHQALVDADGPIRAAVALPDGLPKAGSVEITFLGHATFLLRSAGGISAATDYNGYIHVPLTPDIVTMNNAHSTHYTDLPAAEIKHVLRGWKPGGVAEHNVVVGDIRVRNVPTNVRDYGGTRYAGNSMFVFEIAGLCIAHLGHLHHTLTDEHLKQLGPIDIAMVMVDGAYSQIQERALEVIEQIKPRLVLPMHYFNQGTLERFLAMVGSRYPVRRSDSPTVVVSRVTLPTRETLVLPGH